LTSIRPPLYPALVAGIYRVCGVQDYQAVRAMQIVLSLATTALVYYWRGALYDERVAIAALPSIVFIRPARCCRHGADRDRLTLLLCGFLALIERHISRRGRV
jgi:hypothetical protein